MRAVILQSTPNITACTEENNEEITEDDANYLNRKPPEVLPVALID
jgi:hypothetical protein